MEPVWSPITKARRVAPTIDGGAQRRKRAGPRARLAATMDAQNQPSSTLIRTPNLLEARPSIDGEHLNLMCKNETHSVHN